MECPVCQNSTRPEGNPVGDPIFWCYTCQKHLYKDEFGVKFMEGDDD